MAMTFRMAADGIMKEVRYSAPLSAVQTEDTIIKRIIAHVERHKFAYQIGASVLIVFLAGADFALAAEPTGIDVGARKIYTKLVNVGKWVIIIKGAFDSINATVQGDFIQARKSFLSHLLVYVILLGLPWAFGQVETLFEEV
ncbi:hypothetical protein [Paenibacillus abyssi]|uniref:Uncharacterized protein n=1 Tax=Paenibacillus abyssi TaxID=1340531 RepID=A0A917FLX3_9BACL|nr:hypothetical protein [Paenibacillus abyssi]GGF88687.1 hypothetical protein GCM10010916_02490 [Paenibacillus abyssi]